MSVGVAVLLPKGSHGNGKFCLDVGLSLGLSNAVVDVESSSNDEMCASTDEARSDCTSEEVSTSNCKANPCFTDSSGLERMGSGSSVVSPDSHNNNKNAVEEGKLRLPSSQYKGVVPQPNGRWGAQIYERHQRVWLGTFNKEEDAARAYDRAALKLRGHHAMTNFAPVDDGHPEALFLRLHSKPEIVSMLRKHTYDEELEQSTKDDTAGAKISSDYDDPKVAASNPAAADWASPRELLFEKTVTPSDVGKLNRLVIPKHHAQKYFPLDVTGAEKGINLNFEDSAAKTWRFRYSYWHSSQSYVLTKGWSRYVIAKRLEAGDVVTVHRSTGAAGQLYISFRRRPCNFLAPAASGGPLRSSQFLSPASGYCQLTNVFHSLAPPVQGHPVLWAYGFPTPPSASDDGKSSEVDLREKTNPPSSYFSPPIVKLFGVNLS